MPLEIDYRPVVVPASRTGPRRGAGARVTTPSATPAMVQQPAVRAPDAVRPAPRAAIAWWRRWLGWMVVLGTMPALLTIVGLGNPRGIDGARAQTGTAPWHTDATPAATGGGPRGATSAWDRAPAPIHADADALPPALLPAGPAAQPINPAHTALDRARALQCLTAAIYYEAAREPDAGQRAVAQVVLNRVAHPAFPKTVCGVVYQGSERPGCQFSFACDGSMARAPMVEYWARARRVAETALAGEVYAPVGLATHYHTSAVHPGWADTMTFLGAIGAHRFYRWSGAAGMPRAFSAVYSGGEPVAAPHPRTWASTGADFADPVVLQKAFEAGRMAALRAAPAPVAIDPAIVRAGAAFGQQPLTPPAHATGTAPERSRILPGSGAVRPEAAQQYDNAARWIRQPGT